MRSPLCLRMEAGMSINSDLVQRYRNEMELVEALRMGDVSILGIGVACLNQCLHKSH